MNDQDHGGRGGDLRSLTDTYDWSTTSLGARAHWPSSLETILDMMLSSQFAMCVGWGPDLTLFYNDAYGRSLGRGTLLLWGSR